MAVNLTNLQKYMSVNVRKIRCLCKELGGETGVTVGFKNKGYLKVVTVKRKKRRKKRRRRRRKRRSRRKKLRYPGCRLFHLHLVPSPSPQAPPQPSMYAVGWSLKDTPWNR